MIFWYTTAVDGMRDLLTNICLAGAAVSLAAYLALRHARRIACVSDWLVRVHRSHLAAFLLFAAIATVCAQKGGMGIENGELRMENGGVAVGDSTILHSPFYIQMKLSATRGGGGAAHGRTSDA